MKLVSLVAIVCVFLTTLVMADVILGPDNKPRRAQSSNVIDVAEESADPESISVSQDLSEQPFDFYADDFTVEEQQEDCQ